MPTPITTPEALPRPLVRGIGAGDVYAALHAGWEDFRAAPRFGLFFGGIYAAAGILVFLLLWLLEQPLWIVPFAFAFPLISPFAAIGLYEVSRRREAGEALDWNADPRGDLERAQPADPGDGLRDRGDLPALALVGEHARDPLLGRMSGAVHSNLDAVLSTGNGLVLLLVGGLVGALIAFLLFAITAVSLPLLLDREVDYVTAMTAASRRSPTTCTPCCTGRGSWWRSSSSECCRCFSACWWRCRCSAMPPGTSTGR